MEISFATLQSKHHQWTYESFYTSLDPIKIKKQKVKKDKKKSLKILEYIKILAISLTKNIKTETSKQNEKPRQERDPCKFNRPEKPVIKSKIIWTSFFKNQI